MATRKPAAAASGTEGNGDGTVAAEVAAAAATARRRAAAQRGAAAARQRAQAAAAEPDEPPVRRVYEQPMSRAERTAVGVGIVVVASLLVTQLLAVWPAVIAASSTTAPPPAQPATPILFGIWSPTLNADVVLILMVLIVGSASALIGVSRRFLHFALRDELTQRDEWSYILRPVQGAILALIVYFTLRGGFLGQDATSPVNPYGVAAISGLVGLFTRHAVSKLTDVFDTVFGKPREETEEVEVQREAAPQQGEQD